MESRALISELDRLVAETCSLWDAGWVTFNWRNYTYDHVQRVRSLTLTLCAREGGDPLVCDLASLLHELARVTGRLPLGAEAPEAKPADRARADDVLYEPVQA